MELPFGTLGYEAVPLGNSCSRPMKWSYYFWLKNSDYLHTYVFTVRNFLNPFASTSICDEVFFVEDPYKETHYDKYDESLDFHGLDFMKKLTLS